MDSLLKAMEQKIAEKITKPSASLDLEMCSYIQYGLFPFRNKRRETKGDRSFPGEKRTGDNELSGWTEFLTTTSRVVNIGREKCWNETHTKMPQHSIASWWWDNFHHPQLKDHHTLLEKPKLVFAFEQQFWVVGGKFCFPHFRVCSFVFKDYDFHQKCSNRRKHKWAAVETLPESVCCLAPRSSFGISPNSHRKWIPYSW
jgi:hypothetical protein